MGADVFSDSTYEAIIHLNDTVPTKLAGDVGYLFQTRVWYDTTAAVFMTDSGWSNIGAVRHGDNNSFWLNFTFTPVDAYADQPTITNLTNGQHMGEYDVITSYSIHYTKLYDPSIRKEKYRIVCMRFTKGKNGMQDHILPTVCTIGNRNESFFPSLA